MHIIVIGGGITGLSAAHRLIELSREKNLSPEIILLEGSERLGGVISTIRKDGFLIEEGPDSFITNKPWALDLCRRIGVGPQLIQTNEENRRTFITREDKLIPLPDGFLMMAPTRLVPFLASPLFSWRGKLRIALDLVIPRRPGQNDESVASFVKRRLGKEILDRVAQPMIGGIYTADIEKLSMRAAMPRFPEMEEQHGSILRGMLLEQRRANREQGKESGARYSIFVSLKQGMKSLVDALASRLPEGTVNLGKRVKKLEIFDQTWKVSTDEDEEFEADAVVIAVPSNISSKLTAGFDQSLAHELSRIEYASSAVITLAYKRQDISHSLDGFGFVVPSVENRPLLACSFSSVKFAGRAPEGLVLLRCFAGGALQPDIYELDDVALSELAKRELAHLLQIKGEPIFTLVHRHPKSMPQYNVGHLDLIKRISDRVSVHKGLALSGNAFDGVGIPDCVHSGEMAAEAVLKAFY